MSDIFKKMIERMDETERKRGLIVDVFGESSTEILDSIRGDTKLMEAWHYMNITFLHVCSALRNAHKYLISSDRMCVAAMEGAKEITDGGCSAAFADYAKSLHMAISHELSFEPIMAYGNGELLDRMLKVYFEPKAEEKKGGDDGGK